MLAFGNKRRIFLVVLSCLAIEKRIGLSRAAPESQITRKLQWPTASKPNRVSFFGPGRRFSHQDPEQTAALLHQSIMKNFFGWNSLLRNEAPEASATLSLKDPGELQNRMEHSVFRQAANELSRKRKLPTQLVNKPWGRTLLPKRFALNPSESVGELWFVNDDLPLLAKYLFTSDSLSVQVHPDCAQARARGHERGKAECWYVLDAEPGAVVGLGFRREISREELRRAALDGSITQLIDWRPTAAGDFFLVPPGTVHAIGGGLSLLELQQNSDVTYRLYDYDRPRELHLDDGIAVAHCGPYPSALFQRVDPARDAILADGPHFTLLHTHADALRDRTRWILPIDGHAVFGDETAEAGECLLLHSHEHLDAVYGRLLIGAASPAAAAALDQAA